MTTKVEGKTSGEHVISEANGYRSRDEATVQAGASFEPGSVLQLTGGKYVALVAASSDPVGGVVLRDRRHRGRG